MRGHAQAQFPSPHLAAAMLAAALLMAPAAEAQDGGAPDIPLVCGASLGELGSCFGDVAAWCTQPNDNGQGINAPVASTDCAELDASCTQHGAIGAWCVTGDGTPCAIATDEGTAQLLCGNGNQGPGPGCSLAGGCVNDAPGCDLNATTASCDGDELVLGCSEARQALFLRCQGSCSTGPEGEAHCTDEPEGALCREGVAGCADGLDCLGDGPEGYGRCTAPGPVASVDAGASTWDPEAPGSGCRCVGAPKARGALFALSLLVLAWVSARPRRRHPEAQPPLNGRPPDLKRLI